MKRKYEITCLGADRAKALECLRPMGLEVVSSSETDGVFTATLAGDCDAMPSQLEMILQHNGCDCDVKDGYREAADTEIGSSSDVHAQEDHYDPEPGVGHDEFDVQSANAVLAKINSMFDMEMAPEDGEALVDRARVASSSIALDNFDEFMDQIMSDLVELGMTPEESADVIDQTVAELASQDQMNEIPETWDDHTVLDFLNRAKSAGFHGLVIQTAEIQLGA